MKSAISASFLKQYTISASCVWIDGAWSAADSVSLRESVDKVRFEVLLETRRFESYDLLLLCKRAWNQK